MKPQPSPQPAAPGVVRFYNFLPPGNNFLEEVLAGLARPRKSIPPKYFYDEQGCRLFEAICELPEYYLTRAETAILRAYLAEIAQFIGPDAQLIEFGSGAQAKTRILIEALQTLLYVPVDIAEDTLRASSGELVKLFPLLNVVGICADYTRPLWLPSSPACRSTGRRFSFRVPRSEISPLRKRSFSSSRRAGRRAREACCSSASTSRKTRRPWMRPTPTPRA